MSRTSSLLARRGKNTARSVLAMTLILLVGSCGTLNPKPLKRKDVYVSIGEPRHWTLDDAHYLMAGIHERARSVRIEDLTGLDPNSFNSTRLEQIQSVVSLSATLDEFEGKKNELALDDLETARAGARQARGDEQAAVKNRTELRKERKNLAIQLAEETAQRSSDEALLKLKIDEKDRLNARIDALDSSDEGDKEKIREHKDEVDRLDTKISAIEKDIAVDRAKETATTAKIAAVDQGLKFAGEDITTAQAKQEVGDFTPEKIEPDKPASITSTFAAEALGLLKENPEFKKGLVPSYSVSDRITNYVNAESELLARQLTLMRDEIGVDKTVVFLELPHSIHSTNLKSKSRHVQVDWQIESYCTGDPFEGADIQASSIANYLIEEPIKELDLASLKAQPNQKLSNLIEQLSSTASATAPSKTSTTEIPNPSADLARNLFTDSSNGLKQATEKALRKLKKNIDDLDSEIASLKEDKSNLKKEIEKVEKDIEKLKKDIGTTESLPSDQTTLEEVSKKKTALKEAVQKAKELKGNLQNNKDLKNASTKAKEKEFAEFKLLVETKVKSILRLKQTEPESYIEAACEHGERTVRPIKEEEAPYPSKHESNSERKQREKRENQKMGDWFPVAWDLIPRTNAYNTANYDVRDHEQKLAFNLFKLAGFALGGSANRRQQTFEQYASQSIFGTAYGQGESKFGWVFGPKPGANSVAGGARTTYAALTVARNTTVVTLKARYCVLGKSATIEDKWHEDYGLYSDKKCSPSAFRIFSIPISKNKEFWVERIDYGQVKSGDAASILVKGHGFSPFQTSVLVDGQPLDQFKTPRTDNREIALGPDKGLTDKPTGKFEVTDSKTIAINLRMPTDYHGTPEFTVITPSKTKTLNYLDVELGVLSGSIGNLINNKRPIFHKGLAIDAAPTVTRVGTTKKYEINLTGHGFAGDLKIQVSNDKGALTEVTGLDKEIFSDSHARILVGELKSWKIYLSKKLATSNDSAFITATRKVKPPAPRLAVNSIEVLKSVATSKATYALDLRIKGSGFKPTSEVTDRLIKAKPPAPSGQDHGKKADVLHVVSGSELYVQIETSGDKALVVVRNGKKAVSQYLTVPKVPIVTGVQNTSTNKACGVEAGGDNISISGLNLQNVSKVLFGAAVAQIVSQSDIAISVISPPGKGKVRVVVESSGKINGVSQSSIGGRVNGATPVAPGGIEYSYAGPNCKCRACK